MNFDMNCADQYKIFKMQAWENLLKTQDFLTKVISSNRIFMHFLHILMKLFGFILNLTHAGKLIFQKMHLVISGHNGGWFKMMSFSSKGVKSDAYLLNQ